MLKILVLGSSSAKSKMDGMEPSAVKGKVTQRTYFVISE